MDIGVVVRVSGHWCGHWSCWIGVVLALYLVLYWYCDFYYIGIVSVIVMTLYYFVLGIVFYIFFIGIVLSLYFVLYWHLIGLALFGIEFVLYG